MYYKLKDNSQAVIDIAISAGDTEITLQTGGGAELPDIGAGETAKLVLGQIVSNPTVLNVFEKFEVVEMTAKIGDILTVTRGQDGTTPQSFDGGDLVGCFVLSSHLEQIEGEVDTKANDGEVVHNTGNETVADIKTFSSSPIVPVPTTDYQASNKKYVDDQFLSNASLKNSGVIGEDVIDRDFLRMGNEEIFDTIANELASDVTYGATVGTAKIIHWDGDFYIALWKGDTITNLMGAIFEYDGETLTKGTPQVITSGYYTNGLCKIDSTHIMFGFNDTSSDGRVGVATVNTGTKTFTYVTNYEFTPLLIGSSILTYIEEGFALLVATYDGAKTNGHIIEYDGATTITSGTAVAIADPFHTSIDAYDVVISNTTKAIVLGYSSTYGVGYMHTNPLILDTSTKTITKGTATGLTCLGTIENISGKLIDTDIIAIGYKTDTGSIYAMILDYSGAVPTGGTAVLVASGMTSNIKIDVVDTNTFTIACGFADTSVSLYNIVRSGTAISLSTFLTTENLPGERFDFIIQGDRNNIIFYEDNIGTADEEYFATIVGTEDADEFYKTDASNNQKANFTGAVDGAGTKGDTKSIDNTGVVSGLTGLTPGSIYYLSDTPGQISITPGTNAKEVGLALSSTQLLIKNLSRKAIGTSSGASTITTGFYPTLVLVSVVGGGNATFDESNISNKTQTGFDIDGAFDWVVIG